MEEPSSRAFRTARRRPEVRAPLRFAIRPSFRQGPEAGKVPDSVRLAPVPPRAAYGMRSASGRTPSLRLRFVRRRNGRHRPAPRSVRRAGRNRPTQRHRPSTEIRSGSIGHARLQVTNIRIFSAQIVRGCAKSGATVRPERRNSWLACGGRTKKPSDLHRTVFSYRRPEAFRAPRRSGRGAGGSPAFGRHPSAPADHLLM